MKIDFDFEYSNEMRDPEYILKDDFCRPTVMIELLLQCRFHENFPQLQNFATNIQTLCALR